MDYVVGSVAALISGNVTPNRPKILKKAFTPIKHQPSPNVTPKSELVEDRSIFLSPTMQKKKAIVKKSPKRIFQNQELDVTLDEDGDTSVKSPKADKVKKHLRNELNCEDIASKILLSPKSPKPSKSSKNKESDLVEKTTMKTNDDNHSKELLNEISPAKKKQRKSISESKEANFSKDIKDYDNEKENLSNSQIEKVSKKKKLRSKSIGEIEIEKSDDLFTTSLVENEQSIKQNKKKNKKTCDNNILALDGNTKEENTTGTSIEVATNVKNPKSKRKKDKEVKKGKTNINNQAVIDKKINSSEGIAVNPNAVTNNDSDSEHNSDDEMESENEEINKKALATDIAEESSDDEPQEQTKTRKEIVDTLPTEDVIKRTLFVGNVPFSSKVKKEIKKIFSQYGQIKTVRIRNVPVKDARTTPKMAIIKKELHPNRTTVNVYVKYADASSVDKALAANNIVLNDYHLRVSRSSTTGEVHDSKCSVFVGNIPFALEEEALRAKFVKCGEIDSIRIIRDRKTNAGKGFGYVNFVSKDGVELALALTEEDLTIKNRILRVKRCTQTMQKRPERVENFQNKFQGNKNVRKQFVPGKFQGRENVEKSDGAYRRIANKRKIQEGGEGPPNKKQNLNQPYKEKKTRKEFVGMTAEKKKKNKFNKGQKKKKALSEILTKK